MVDPRPHARRLGWRGLIALALAGLASGSIACGLLDDESDDDDSRVELFEVQPPFDLVRASGECSYFQRPSPGSTVRPGHLWTYEDGRPVLHRVGWDGFERIVETWHYDDQGHLLEFARRIAADAPDDFELPDARVEGWSYDDDGRLTSYYLDANDDGRVEQAWRWSWDAQGRLVLREADTDPNPGFEYREVTTFPSPDLELTDIDVDGDGRPDIRLERRFQDGQVISSSRTSEIPGIRSLTELRPFGSRQVDYGYVDSGGNPVEGGRLEHSEVTTPITGEGELQFTGGFGETCFLDEATDEVTRYGWGKQPQGFDYDVIVSAPLPPEPLRWDARANVGELVGRAENDFVYDGEFEAFHCGQALPSPPTFPTPHKLTDDALGIDLLCEPRLLACRHLVPERVKRCPQY